MNSQAIIIGSGIAGLSAALIIAKRLPVTIVTKSALLGGSTRLAQGGIATVLAETDTFAQHIKDTLEAGSNHNNNEAVKLMVENGPLVIKELIDLGVDFDQHDGSIALTREGGHAARRIAHHKDTTGLEIETKLVQKVEEHKNITILENTLAVDLVVEGGVCQGIIIINSETEELELLSSAHVLMASGGLGQIYEVTTNPAVATGDGFAMAYRAGATLKDMEFIQFHPTAFTGGDDVLLLSEALRGEGALIVNELGERFMQETHVLAELAPRDVVARAIYLESKKGQVYLDMTAKSADYLQERFPYIYKTLQKSGYDLATDLIPIMPAAHFCCGGIATDLDGKANVDNLFAIGEVACTGVHGANRLASNSLLEAAVFAKQAAMAIQENDIAGSPTPAVFTDWQTAFAILKNSDAELLVYELGNIQLEIKAIMQEKVGIVRNLDDLTSANEDLIQLEERLYGFCRSDLATESVKHTNTDQLISFVETLNMVQTAILVVEAALERPQSLGCHFRLR